MRTLYVERWQSLSGLQLLTCLKNRKQRKQQKKIEIFTHKRSSVSDAPNWLVWWIQHQWSTPACKQSQEKRNSQSLHLYIWSKRSKESPQASVKPAFDTHTLTPVTEIQKSQFTAIVNVPQPHTHCQQQHPPSSSWFSSWQRTLFCGDAPRPSKQHPPHSRRSPPDSISAAETHTFNRKY